MVMSIVDKLTSITLPRLTLRNEQQWRRWYDELQQIARAYVIERDHLARLYAAAKRADIDLSHLLHPDGSLAHDDVEHVQQELMRLIADDVELIKLLINVDNYPRRREAIMRAIDFLRELDATLPPPESEEWSDVPYDVICDVVERFFRAMR